MARLTIFSYRAGGSILHRLDPRFKLLFMLMLSLWTLNSSLYSICFSSVLVLALLHNSSVRYWQIFRELKLLVWFLLFVFLTRSLVTPGEPLLDYYGIAPTVEGVAAGARFCWRLVFIILVSLAFVVSTTSAEIKAAIEFYCAKVPFVPEKRLSTMLGLLIRFIPLIMTQVRETRDAQDARCIGMKKNPVHRLIKLTIPLLRRIFQNGDRLAIAMASRCYTEKRTGAELKSAPLDWAALAFVVVCFFIT